MLSILDPCVTRVRDNMGLRLWRHSRVLRQQPKTLFYQALCFARFSQWPPPKAFLYSNGKKVPKTIWYERIDFLFQIQIKIWPFHFAIKSFPLPVLNLDFLILPSNAKNNHLTISREFLEMWLKYLAQTIACFKHRSKLVFCVSYYIGNSCVRRYILYSFVR